MSEGTEAWKGRHRVSTPLAHGYQARIHITPSDGQPPMTNVYPSSRFLIAIIVLIGTTVDSTLLFADQERDSALPMVVVLATGGTIASTYDSISGALRAALSGEEIVEAVPGLGEVARVEVEQIANVGSRDMTPAIWTTLARRANELLALPDITGVVVTHGTDTLEETAYFLDLTVTSTKPVVVVGAQRAPAFFDSDGPRNLLNAVRVAVAPEAVGMGDDRSDERPHQCGA